MESVVVFEEGLAVGVMEMIEIGNEPELGMFLLLDQFIFLHQELKPLLIVYLQCPIVSI
jgi:hypothetical protein